MQARSACSPSTPRCSPGWSTRSRDGRAMPIRAASGPRPAVLHLFAYTGLATLATVAAGARLTHVDASRPAVGWARGNATRSGLDDAPVRWIVDDAVAFTGREIRRGTALCRGHPRSAQLRAWAGVGRLAAGARPPGSPRRLCRGPRARRLRAPDRAHGGVRQRSPRARPCRRDATAGGVDGRRRPRARDTRWPRPPAGRLRAVRGAGMMTTCAPPPRPS